MRALTAIPRAWLPRVVVTARAPQGAAPLGRLPESVPGLPLVLLGAEPDPRLPQAPWTGAVLTEGERQGVGLRAMAVAPKVEAPDARDRPSLVAGAMAERPPASRPGSMEDAR